MAIPLSRIASPTVLLYAVVLVSQFADGFYLARQIDPPAIFTIVSWLGLLWLMGWWLRADSRKRSVSSVYDVGLFLYVAWPIVMPYYLVKTRGAKGLLIILGFICASFGAAILGVVLSMLFQ
jgi:hypothetical protein